MEVKARLHWVALGLWCCGVISSSDVNLALLYHGNMTWFLGVLFYSSQMMQLSPESTCIHYSFKTWTTSYPWKEQSIKRPGQVRATWVLAVQYHPSRMSKNRSYDNWTTRQYWSRALQHPKPRQKNEPLAKQSVCEHSNRMLMTR